MKETTRQYRPSLGFYHPNGKGTGSAIRMSLHPAHNNHDGCIMLQLANQVTVGDRTAAVPVFPTFDWENKVTVKLDFNDLSKMLQVFRGECEAAGEGKGLYHRSAKYNTKIGFRHIIEPVQGYSLDVSRAELNGANESRVHFVMNAAESMGLMEAIAGAMCIVSFGIPMVIPRTGGGATASGECGDDAA